jgi:hypothetical protein
MSLGQLALVIDDIFYGAELTFSQLIESLQVKDSRLSRKEV